MDPRPDYGRDSYKGHNRLQDKVTTSDIPTGNITKADCSVLWAYPGKPSFHGTANEVFAKEALKSRYFATI